MSVLRDLAEGRAWVEGMELGRARRTEIRNIRRSIVTVFQQAYLVRHLCALGNVLLKRMGYLPTQRIKLGRVLPALHLAPLDRTHRPGLSAKKSRSTFNCLIS